MCVPICTPASLRSRDAALELVDREIGLLHRERPQPDEAAGAARDNRRDVVVQQRREVERVLRLRPVAEHHRNRREHLHVDAGGGAVLEAAPRVPAVVLDLAEERAVQDHPRAPRRVVVELDEARRPVALGQIREVLRQDVRVEVDLQDAVSRIHRT